MIKFQLKNRVMIIPTSFHGSRFSDGTIFDPTPAQIWEIKKDWKCIEVKREFTKIDDCPVPASMSMGSIPKEGMEKLQSIPKDEVVLVSFMVVAALWDMGIDIRDSLKNVLATNATPETSREAPDRKVWDVNNFAY